MTRSELNKEERECLQMWFRQAIAQVEREEALHSLLKEQALNEGTKIAHHAIAARRRPSRRLAGTHAYARV
jgi:hypothetical protein